MFGNRPSIYGEVALGLTVNMLTGESAALSFDYMGESVHVKYSPGKYTPEMEDRVRESAFDENEGGSTVIAHVLVEVLEWWDVEHQVPGSDGQSVTEMYPIDEEHVGRLNNKFLARLWFEIMQDMTPGEARNSGAGLRRRGR